MTSKCLNVTFLLGIYIFLALTAETTPWYLLNDIARYLDRNWFTLHINLLHFFLLLTNVLHTRAMMHSCRKHSRCLRFVISWHNLNYVATSPVLSAVIRTVWHVSAVEKSRIFVGVRPMSNHERLSCQIAKKTLGGDIFDVV